jgi:hypothetical protein
VVAVSLLVVVSIFAVLGVLSSARLADVRAHTGTLRTGDNALETRNIAGDWSAVLLISNIGLAVAVIVHLRRRK